MLIFSIYCYVSVVGRVIGTGNKLEIWSGMGWGYHLLSLPEKELEYKQFLTVVHVAATEVGDDTTVFDLKPYFLHRMHRGPDVSGRQWRPNPAKLDSVQYPFMPLFSGCLRGK